MITILTILLSLTIFTLISFAFGLGILVGYLFIQPSKLVDKEWEDSFDDFQRDFVDFTKRN